MKRLLILFGLMFISSAYANSFAQTKIRSESVKLKTGDGTTLHGALWTPASGKARIGIIIAPGGGSEFYSDWLVWLGENFARSGYIALSMNRRDHGQEQWYHNFEPSGMDHKYMIDFLASRGAQAVILVGHSYGTVTAPYYVMASDDTLSIQVTRTGNTEPLCPPKGFRIERFCPDRQTRESTRFGCTPLMRAAEGGDLVQVRALLDKGADVNHPVPKWGHTALMLAAGKDQREVVKILAGLATRLKNNSLIKL